MTTNHSPLDPAPIEPTPIAQTDKQTARKPLRLWPGVAAAVLILLAWFVIPFFIPESILYGMMVSAIGILAIFLWWMFFSRAPWLERIGAIVLIVIAMFVTSRLIHISIANGAMGFLFPVLVVPVMSLALVAWAVASRRIPNRFRRITLVAAILLVCGASTLIRTGGLSSSAGSDLHLRWTKSPEERLLAQGEEPPVGTSSTAAPSADNSTADWPGFRGPNRDGIVRGTHIKTDWATSPPVELWRRPIGPGWSSFAVRGELVYTQEQRGSDEIVACYNLTSGKPVWKHRDAARFWESNAGAGPRGTPTLSNGRVYSLGATGILNVLDAGTGAVVWSRNAAADTGAKLPGWGFAGSPLVIDDVVVVATAGSLAAYNINSGEQRWLGPANNSGYSSPHLVTINGVKQVILLNGIGVISVAPSDGKKLWEHPLPSGTRIVQPGLTAEGDLLVHDGEGNGMRRLTVSQGSGGWSVAERWNEFGLNPYFNDFVVHKGHAFGFEGTGLACIDLANGNRKWKGGQYGNGQLVLLSDQDLMLVLSEKGEMALVKATTDQFAELARLPAIKGKTWNHPVLAGDVLLLRNGEEMAAFRLQRG